MTENQERSEEERPSGQRPEADSAPYGARRRDERPARRDQGNGGEGRFGARRAGSPRAGGPQAVRGTGGTPRRGSQADRRGGSQTQARWQDQSERPGDPARRDARYSSQRGGKERYEGLRPGEQLAPERRGGSRLVPREQRKPEPAIAEGVTGKELDRGVHQQLRTLSKENAEGVAQHLVMVARLLEAEDLDGALAHAETATRRAGRVPAAREALAFVHYRREDWAKALNEFRTVRRLSGSNHVLPYLVDCERALGRADRALELATGPQAQGLSLPEQVELAIVVAGIRRDLGQAGLAAAQLEKPARRTKPTDAWAARMFYAYADVLLADGQEDAAYDWFARAASADSEGETDADERLAEMDGIVLIDLEPEEDEGETATGGERVDHHATDEPEAPLPSTESGGL